MDIQVDITEDFEKEFKKLTKKDQEIISKNANLLIKQLQSGIHTKLYRVKGLVFPDGFDKRNSSLYIFRATQKLRIILSLDNNPISTNKVLTFYCITNHDETAHSFMMIAKYLYK